ncbi:MAG: 3-phosphoshikimate 1-carboxyvinyltransferase [Clostridia bacterium]|nr:3-phosphoshikimate 1-carboxyvinyltransferase [Clostridia bacterium]
MNAVVYPSHLSGSVTAPPSKSAAHRALICSALADRPTVVALDTMNRDIEATAACLRALGAGIKPAEGGLSVTPIARSPESAILDCEESGSTLRFLMPVAAALGTRTLFVGHGRLPLRPNAALTEALRRHGAQIDSDLLPMNLRGPLRGGRWTLPGNVSSQYISGLLFALPLLDDDSEIVLSTALQSGSYVSMTLEALRTFDVRVETFAGGWRVPARQRYHAPALTRIEGDWSAAAFWFAANALGAGIEVKGLNADSLQGDRAVRGMLGQPDIDASDVPDLVPALAVAAAALPQKTVITGAARLRLKESDRLAAVAELVRALGAAARETEDGLTIEGRAIARQAGVIPTVNGHNDHRIVMAAAVAAACGPGPVRITGVEAVDKSYPEFFRDLESLGGHVDVELNG